MDSNPPHLATGSATLALAIDYAFQESTRFRHEYIGSEHLLLAIIRLSSNICTDLLRKRKIRIRKLRWHASRLLMVGPEATETDELPITPRAVKAIKFADSISSARNEVLEADHLFLGIIHDQESIAVELLVTAGITIEELDELSLRHGAR